MSDEKELCDGCSVEIQIGEVGPVVLWPDDGEGALLFHNAECLAKFLNPPDLSVHITDGMGSQDRVGG